MMLGTRLLHHRPRSSNTYHRQTAALDHNGDWQQDADETAKLEAVQADSRWDLAISCVALERAWHAALSASRFEQGLHEEGACRRRAPDAGCGARTP